MTTKEKIHTILLGFHTNTETFQSANKKIEDMLNKAASDEHVALVDDAHNIGYEQGFKAGYERRDLETRAALA